MPACLAGQPLPAGADPYADHAWRQRLPVNPESRQFPVGVLLSSLSEIVAWSLSCEKVSFLPSDYLSCVGSFFACG